MTRNRVQLDAAIVCAEIDRLMVEHPELADDEDFRRDVIEGQTDAMEILERLADEKNFKEEMAVMQKIVEVEERQRRRKQDIEFEELQILKEQQEVMKNIELLMKCYGKK